jgi:hypothetical protein
MEIIKPAKVNVVMDASQYDMFLLCPYRYHNRYKLNKQAPTKNAALDRGTVVHVANEIYYQCLKDGAKYDYAVGAALLKMKEAFVMESDLDNAEAQPLIDTMEEYFDYWRVEDQNLEIQGVEEPFMYLLFEDDDIRIYMTGKIDLRVNTKGYTNLPYDHKTFSRSSPVNQMSNQFKNYCTAANSNYLIVNRIGLQKTLKPHDKYLRTPISYDHLILEAWRDNVIRNIMYYLQCAADNVWPTNETSCDKYNRLCEYYEVCMSSGIESKVFKLENNFITTDPWDVTKVLKKSSEMLKDQTE